MDRRRMRFDTAKAERAMRFANELSDLLYELKIKHKALAEQLGVGFHTVNSWTRGVDPSVPGDENLNKLCDLLEARKAGAGKRLAASVGHSWQPPAVEVSPTPEASRINDSKPEPDLLPQNLHNLPVFLSGFVGKESEVEEITRLVQAQRLVTLTGAGGIGKTRLSLEVARKESERGAWTGGVWLVELAPLRDPGRLVSAVAQMLGVQERSGSTLQDALQDYLQQKSILLVLDNCEHLIDACAELAAALLRSCKGLSILATSRESLGINGEFVWRVSSLAMPPRLLPVERRRPEELAEYDAARMFVARARAVSPNFTINESNVEAVEEICRRLDGMPLAIELATALLRYLSPEQVASGLNKRFDLLTGGSRDALPRHKTLRAAVEWSYDLLTDAEKALFRRMSVFAGDCGLEAVEAVCAGGELERYEVRLVLSRLVDKSFALAETRRGEGRYRMLETVREFARAELDRLGETQRLQSGHANYYTGLAEEVGPKIRQGSGRSSMARLDAEQDNLNAALVWSIENSGWIALRLIGALVWYWHLNSFFREGVDWLRKALASGKAVGAPDTWTREEKLIMSRALFSGAKCGRWCGEFEAAWPWIEQSHALMQDLGESALLVDMLIVFAPLGRLAGKFTWEEEIAQLEGSLLLARRIGDRWGENQLLTGLGWRAIWRNDFAGSEKYFNEALFVARELGHTQHLVGALLNLGDVACTQGDWDRAKALYYEGVDVSRRENIVWAISLGLTNLARVMLELDNTIEARALLVESLNVARSRQSFQDRAWVLLLLAKAALHDGKGEQACKLMGAADALLSVLGADSVLTRLDVIERVSAEVKNLMADPTCARMWTEGRALDLESALAFALEVGADRA